MRLQSIPHIYAFDKDKTTHGNKMDFQRKGFSADAMVHWIREETEIKVW